MSDENPDVRTVERAIDAQYAADMDAQARYAELLVSVVKMHVELDNAAREINGLRQEVGELQDIQRDLLERMDAMEGALNSVLAWSRWPDGECVQCEERECVCDADDMRAECRKALGAEEDEDGEDRDCEG